MDLVLYALIYLCAAFAVLLLAGIIIYVLIRGVSSINWGFLTTVTSVRKGTVGIAGNIVNTILIVLLTMIIATPVGVGAAIYLNEYAKPGKLVSIIEFATETLSGIPSIIFGLFGMMFFGQTLGLGYSLLTGALTLILMVLPLITRNTQEALKTVPNSYRHGAVGLGAGKWYTIRTILLPSSLPGINRCDFGYWANCRRIRSAFIYCRKRKDSAQNTFCHIPEDFSIRWNHDNPALSFRNQRGGF
jgi:phosphate transport system permease protein